MSKEKDEQFKPYVPADKTQPELTVTSVVMGIILAVVFGAANAYLGLRVGMTVSASIPAAVVSMGVLRILLKRNSVLESNMVQTIGSAGESLAAGVIFTMPVLFLWSSEGVTDKPGMLTIMLIALLGGLLGVLFMIPLRKALIVKEHKTLPYPEGTACAEVLLAGEKGGASAKSVFVGMGLSALIKFVVDGLKMIPGTIAIPVKALKTEFSTEIYPALVGVGYICGLKISSYLFAGGMLGWFVLIPAIVAFGGETILYPGTATIAEMYEAGGASAIWSSYIRYIGAGAVAAGGIFSLIKSLPLIFGTFRDTIKSLKGSNADSDGKMLRTDKDLNIKLVVIGILVLIVLIAIFPDIPVSIPGALIIAIFGFFFGAVSSRMVGLVGSSNNPVSGMTIATLLCATVILKASGNVGVNGMIGAIAIGSIICIVAAMAGDTSQDLKTGYILGSTPVKQQIGELIGAVVSAIAIGGVLLLLDAAWGFGSAELSAPQATLMKMIVEGVMNGNLPWTLVFIGVFIAVVIEILGIPVLPVAIGLYLPLEMSVPIMIGGVIKHFISKKESKEEAENEAGGGVLFCSGLIAGEGIIGIVLAILAVLGVDSVIDFSGSLNLGMIGGLLILAILIVGIVRAEKVKSK
ncbi:MAG: oligopeptide transporter, OPT family [Lachnospiraceae bacterium]|nr:oligopeptide transporter, OPT family [Lachnospiraceae bacterium]